MKQLTIGIVGSGPEEALADLKAYDADVDLWIGADKGNLYLMRSGLAIQCAVGDFDSVSSVELEQIKNRAAEIYKMPREKDETDLELALRKAFEMRPKTILMFGVTAGRKDHEIINIQLLYRILEAGCIGKIIDRQNEIQLTSPGTYKVLHDPHYPYVSFIPFTERVDGISLEGFYYPLKDANISWGSTLCISNKLTSESGTFSYRRGILLLIKSRDSIAI